MKCDCNGFAGANIDAQISVDPAVMVTAQNAGVVKIGLSENAPEPNTYFGIVDKFDEFTLPQMPGFIFSMSSGRMDLKTDQKIEPNTLAAFYPNSNQNEWRGLYLDGVKVKLPAEYDFTGAGKSLSLDQGAFGVAAGGGYGKFKKINLVPLAEGKLGAWRYSVDTMQLGIVASRTDSTVLAGRIRVPLLDEAFAYHSQLNINSSFTEMNVKPQPGKRGMSMWGGEIDINDTTEVKAQLKDVNGQRRFFPSAKLYGKLTIDLDKAEFDAKLTGNKSLLLADLKQALGISGDVDFKLPDLPLRGLAIDPYEMPDLRYKLDSYGIGQGKDSVTIGGIKKKIGELALMYKDTAGTEELGLKIIAIAKSSLVQFIFWGKASADGGFTFDRIEVKTENVRL